MWFEEISFRGFPGRLKSVGRTVAVAVAVETAAPAEMDQKQLEQLRSESKQDKVKVAKFTKLPKVQMSKILQWNLHRTHILKLLDKMYKYELDPTRTVGTTERTWDAGQTDGQSETNNFVVQGV